MNIDWHEMHETFIKDGERKVWVHTWGRDCDGCESDSIRLINANETAWSDLENDAYEGREGPVRLTIISEEEAKEFKSSFRDTYAERMGY